MRHKKDDYDKICLASVMQSFKKYYKCPGSKFQVQNVRTMNSVNMYLYALLWTIPFNMGGYVTIIFMILEKISRLMCFQPNCPDFLLKLSGILDPRMPPFGRSGVLVQKNPLVLIFCYFQQNQFKLFCKLPSSVQAQLN